MPRPSSGARRSGGGGGGRDRRSANDTSMYYASDSGGEEDDSVSSDEDGFVGWGAPSAEAKERRKQRQLERDRDRDNGGTGGGGGATGRGSRASGGRGRDGGGSGGTDRTSTTNGPSSHDDGGEHPENKNTAAANARPNSLFRHKQQRGASSSLGGSSHRSDRSGGNSSDTGGGGGSSAGAPGHRSTASASASPGGMAFSPFGSSATPSTSVGRNTSDGTSRSASSVGTGRSALSSARAAVREGKSSLSSSLIGPSSAGAGRHTSGVADRTSTAKSFVPAGSFRVSKSGASYVQSQEDVRAKFRGAGITEDVIAGEQQFEMGEEDEEGGEDGEGGGDELATSGRGGRRARRKSGDHVTADLGERVTASGRRARRQSGDHVDAAGFGGGGAEKGERRSGRRSGGGAGGALAGMNARRARSRSPTRKLAAAVGAISSAKYVEDKADETRTRRETRKSSAENMKDKYNAGDGGDKEGEPREGDMYEMPLKGDDEGGEGGGAGAPPAARAPTMPKRRLGSSDRLAEMAARTKAGVASANTDGGPSSGFGINENGPGGATKSKMERRKSGDAASRLAQSIVPEENKIKSAASMILAAQRAKVFKKLAAGPGADGATKAFAGKDHRCEVGGSDSSSVNTDTSFEVTDFSSDDGGDASRSAALIPKGPSETEKKKDASNIWSVRVRLISAVDLPSNLTPNAPLCPLLKFGIITSGNVGDVPDEPDPYGGGPPGGPGGMGGGPGAVAYSGSGHGSSFGQSDNENDGRDSASGGSESSDDSIDDNGDDDGDRSDSRRRRERRERKKNKRKNKSSGRETVLSRLHSRGLSSIPKSRVRCSSGKILSPRDNGSMEWHEEMRWDGIRRPLQTVLAVELCARAILPPPAAPPPSPAAPLPSGLGASVSPSVSMSSGLNQSSAATPGLMAEDGGSVGGASAHDNMSATSRDWQQQPDDASASSSQQGGSSQQQGLRGLWRRGRKLAEQAQSAQQQQAQQRGGGGAQPQNISGSQRTSSSTGSGDDMEKASAAAAVAKFIAGDRPQEPYPAPPRHGYDANLGPMDGAGGSDPLGGSESATLSAAASEGVGTKHDRDLGAEGGVAPVADPGRPRKKPRRSQMVDDLRLGTLVIPLSRLPLEDATSSPNGEAVVERWYQLDTSAVSGGRDSSSRAVAKKALSPRRCPSVLLEISFCTAQTLDDSEDEADNEGAGDMNWDGSGAGGDGGAQAVEGVAGAATGPGMVRRRSSLASGSSNVEIKPSIKAVEAKPEEPKKDEPKLSRREKKELVKRLAKEKEDESTRIHGPKLKPGVVDFIAVVGACDIGDQTNDDGAKGWVQSTPECTVLERWPEKDEFHHKSGRKSALPDKVEWFCFPEGCKLWRGSEPPHSSDLNLKRFSASSPPTMASSIAAFDACLNCTTSLTWFVLASNSDDYGSRCVKTYGVCIRFFVPAPAGIDRTQDDFAQMMMGGAGGMGGPDGMGGASGGGGSGVSGSGRNMYDAHRGASNASSGGVGAGGSAADANSKRLWVPLGILMTTQHPIVGHIEAMLLRMCETLASRANSPSSTSSQWIWSVVHNDLANLIVNFQAPIPGVLHTSVPFLSGERLHLTLPPPTGLPPLPHGASITSVCRLLGAEGLTVLLSAVLSECKILVHSQDVANLCMVAEVITCLIYPFIWALPYIPVLPEAMLEFVDAPLSYLLGIPTCNMQYIDKVALQDVVVIDLDNGFSSPDYFDGTRGGGGGGGGGSRGMRSSKVPTPLPASVSSNISKAVFKLLKEEEEVEEQYGAAAFSCGRHLPRLECESLAEREFRIALALQVCSLVRGYQECLFFVSASQPVFNRDRFLRNAPALFEERRGNIQALALPGASGPHGAGGAGPGPSQRILSPRSKRFLSNLVNTQHFHGLLENLDHDDAAFFHEVMDTFDRNESDASDGGGAKEAGGGAAASGAAGSALSPSQLSSALSHLSAALEKVEQKVPTYRVERDPAASSSRDNNKPRRGSFFLDHPTDLDPDGMDGFEEMMEAHEEADACRDPLGYDVDDGSYMTSFTHDLLRPICMSDIEDAKEKENKEKDGKDGAGGGGAGGRGNGAGDEASVGSGANANEGGVHSVSLEYLVQLEKQPWKYCKLFEVTATDEEEADVDKAKAKAKERQLVLAHQHRQRQHANELSLTSPIGGSAWGGAYPAATDFKVRINLWPTVKLKDAIGERRFRAWKLAQERKMYTTEDSMRMSSTNLNENEKDNALDLTSLLSSVGDEVADQAGGPGGGASSSSIVSASRAAGGPNSSMSFEQQRVHDARDRDVLRRCLEKAYEGAQKPGAPAAAAGGGRRDGSAGKDFNENGVDLITEAESALRNPSAQRFLVSVLSQRTRLENQRRNRRGGGHGHGGAGHDRFGNQNEGGGHRPSNQSSVSRLQPSAFECLVRLCAAMLQACMEGSDYEAAYQLLTHTAGFCTVVPKNPDAAAGASEAIVSTGGTEGGKDKDGKEKDQNTKIVYMTARIGRHPVFADLRLWEKVMALHLADRQRDRNSNADSSGNPSSAPTEDKDKDPSKSGEGGDENDDENDEESDQYEAAVSTLYEMLGYGVPAEDLAKFATRVADRMNWFGTERGQALLMLARRLSVKRDDGDAIESGGPGAAGESGDLMAAQGKDGGADGGKEHEKASSLVKKKAAGGGLCICDDDKTTEWHEVAWSHPAADNTSSSPSGVSRSGMPPSGSLRGGPPSSRAMRSGGYSTIGTGGPSEASNDGNNNGVPAHLDGAQTVALRPSPHSDSDVLDPVGSPPGGTGRTAVTSLASFGSNVVASGGLDGSVFLAHTIRFGSPPLTSKGDPSTSAATGGRQFREPLVCGVRLEWGNAGSRGIGVGSTTSAIDGEFGVGAVSCLAAARGAGYQHASGSGGAGDESKSSGGVDGLDEEELLAAMEGCRVVAGTTGGDLRVWSVKDVYATTIVASSGRDGEGSAAADALSANMADMRLNHGAGGASSAYLKSGGRGDGGGASGAARSKFPLRGRALSGHRGGVTCVDVPSHVYRPDSLVSGGADGLIKLWSLRQQPPGRRPSSATPTGAVGGVAARHAQQASRAGRQGSSRNLAGGGGGDSAGAAGYRGRHSLGTEPLETLTGHGGRVLCIKTAWHGDRLLSGGADRTVRLWDLAGSGGKCLHTLHGHLGWVTQCHYWGPHTVVSASTDRSIALWDARVGASPLFVLRYHRSPVSDLLVGSRNDFLMVSAGGDGICATWDFRKLSAAGGGPAGGAGAGGGEKGGGGAQPAVIMPAGGSANNAGMGGGAGAAAASNALVKGAQTAGDTPGGGARQPPPTTRTVREPAATMNHCKEGSPRVSCSGTVLLGRGAGFDGRSSVMSVGVDGRSKEWEIASGRLLYRRSVGHTDAVSCVSTFLGGDGLVRGKGAVSGGGGAAAGGGGDGEGGGVGGTITCSWDGTVRLRKLALKKPQ